MKFKNPPVSNDWGIDLFILFENLFKPRQLRLAVGCSLIFIEY